MPADDELASPADTAEEEAVVADEASAGDESQPSDEATPAEEATAPAETPAGDEQVEAEADTDEPPAKASPTDADESPADNPLAGGEEVDERDSKRVDENPSHATEIALDGADGIRITSAEGSPATPPMGEDEQTKGENEDPFERSVNFQQQLTAKEPRNPERRIPARPVTSALVSTVVRGD